MRVADEALAELRNRADRTLGGADLEQLFFKWRKIIGPPPEQMSALAKEALDKLRAGDEPTPVQQQALERAIRLLRPALPVKAGRLGPLDSETRSAFPDWDAFAAAIEPYLPAIGRIDIPPRSDVRQATPFATGFLIAKDTLVTNEHVVDLLTVGTGRLIPGQAQVRFDQELGQSRMSGPVPIDEVIACDANLDLALLRLGRAAAADLVIPLDTAEVETGMTVAAVGFPIPDGVDEDIAGSLLGTAIGVKRVSPGVVIRRQPSLIFHDCTTLPGSSGSPVFTLAGPRLVGVHFDGLYLARNRATCGPAMCQFLKENLP